MGCRLRIVGLRDDVNNDALGGMDLERDGRSVDQSGFPKLRTERKVHEFHGGQFVVFSSRSNSNFLTNGACTGQVPRSSWAPTQGERRTCRRQGRAESLGADVESHCIGPFQEENKCAEKVLPVAWYGLVFLLQ